MRTIVLNKQALDDLKHWSLNDVKLLRKIFEPFESTLRDPFSGIGKPEALKADLRGYWSRRVSDEHRMVYTVTAESIIVISCRSHYK